MGTSDDVVRVSAGEFSFSWVVIAGRGEDDEEFDFECFLCANFVHDDYYALVREGFSENVQI